MTTQRRELNGPCHQFLDIIEISECVDSGQIAPGDRGNVGARAHCNHELAVGPRAAKPRGDCLSRAVNVNDAVVGVEGHLCQAQENRAAALPGPAAHRRKAAE